MGAWITVSRSKSSPLTFCLGLTVNRGAFDISLLASLASHLSYWSDEDVSHFIISQLLSRQRVVRNSRGSDGNASQ
jgi:hypothetical protein